MRDKARKYASEFRSSLHLKLAAANAISGLLPDFVSGVIRGRLYRAAGFDVRRGAFIMGNLELLSSLPGFYDKLLIESGVVVGNHVTMNLDANVYVGRNVTVGPYVLIYTGTHSIGPGSQRRLGTVVAKPVTVEEGSWIGVGAILLPGVTVGHGSVVAAGAVVTANVPPNSYVEGNPAQVTRQLPWGDR